MKLSRLGTYGSLTEANLVKAKLETFGIEAIVESDVMTSSIPTFDQMHGVKVLVKESDLAEAYEVLERMLPAGDDSAGEE
ncbi:MAG: DUF2007 domain-containing protein [Actinomycetota bacterium]|nr:DUF2007 domain-containing protein [Actinomycetota bacterium]